MLKYKKGKCKKILPNIENACKKRNIDFEIRYITESLSGADIAKEYKDEEKIKMCEIVTNAGAEYIKTSTGFSTGGATFDDVALMRKHIGEEVKVKAAGGIASFDDAEKLIASHGIKNRLSLQKILDFSQKTL